MAVRKKTACVECRQQKMRCEGDTSRPDSPSCLRCRQLQISCIFSAPFKRTHKRKRLQELEEEASALKQRLLSTSSATPINHRTSSDAPVPPVGENIDISRIATARTTLPNVPSANNDPTLLRTIAGLEITSHIINDCFELYFKNNHAMLPLLDPSVTPNTFYHHEPFLFWAIVSTGSQRYVRQPTLAQALSRPVMQLALQSLFVRSKPIERIKALILLLNWPVPNGMFYKDPSFLLVGTLLHMAMQCGLHAPSFSQDFSKTYSQLPENELIRRAEMWAYVVITYQRTNSGSGQASLFPFEIYHEQTHFKILLEKLPTTLKIQLQISNIISRAQKTLLDLGLFSMTPQQERAMDALLRGFSTELDSSELSASSVWDHLYSAIARQDLALMHFYKSAATLDMQSCLSIFDATADVLARLRDIDKNNDLHRVCTRYITTTTILSVASIARVLKGPFASYLDQIRGYELFEFGVRFLRSCSVEKGDFGERAAAFSERIWQSKKVFRDPDGSINITLRVRNRLSAGPLHDVIRCWKDEFVDLEYRYSHVPGMDIEAVIPSSNTTSGLDATLSPSSVPHRDQCDFFAAPEFFFNDELWGEWELSMTDT